MRKAALTLTLLLAIAAPAAASEAFDPAQTVSLELKDASLTDILSTLGALANLPVVIEPGIKGNVTLNLKDVPYEKVLGILSKEYGISVRIEDGKLLATRAAGAAAAVPAVPAQFRDSPRILAADYASAAAGPPPLLVRMSGRGAESCAIVGVGAGGGGVAEIPIPRTDGSENLVIADMGYDPVLRSRALAFEGTGGSEIRWALAVSEGAPVSVQKTREGKPLRLLVSQDPKRIAEARESGCSEANFQPAEAGNPVLVRIEASADFDGVSKPLFAPRIQTLTGTVFKVRGGASDPAEGPMRGYSVSGYVSRDGKRVAFSFKVLAYWTDPEDQRPYAFSQSFGPLGFHTFSAGFVLPAALTPGVATPRALALRVSAER